MVNLIRPSIEGIGIYCAVEGGRNIPSDCRRLSGFVTDVTAIISNLRLQIHAGV
jgi:hypothetical protein